MSKASSAFKKLMYPFLWFENNQRVVYKHRLRILLGFWATLIIVLILVASPFWKFNVLALSAMAVSLSSILASFMVWFTIETNKRVRQENEQRDIYDEFVKFYAYSFAVQRAISEACNYESQKLPNEIPLMVVSMLKQLLNEHSKLEHIHKILNATEQRLLAEHIFGLHYCIAKLERALNEDVIITRGGVIRESLGSMNWIMNHALKRAFDELNISEVFDNQERKDD